MPPPTQMLTRSLVSARMSLEVEHQSSTVPEVVVKRKAVGPDRHPVKLPNTNCQTRLYLGIYAATKHHGEPAVTDGDTTG